ncbi:MAG: hypothetical protein Q7S50_02030 [bacterium]|nr:hypothetical protein [bacterium]
MRTHTTLSFYFALVLFTCLFAFFPFVLYAQTVAQGDLRSTIRAELLSDPRTSGLSNAELDAMVDLLTDEAGKQGMTVQDIQWRPQNTQSFTASEQSPVSPDACRASRFLCMFNEAFGFAGPDATIAFTLGAASMGLVWIIAEMLHRRRHPVRSDNIVQV